MAFPYRSALVTGASAGFGTEFARQLAPQVERLTLIARRLDRLEALKAELARPGLRIDCHAVDLGDEAGVGHFLALLEPGSIDLVVNNAGVGDHGYFDEGEWARVKAMLEVNIHALTRITHALLPGMIAARHGAVLNVSSIAAFLPMSEMAVYAATKAYVSSFTEAVRAETLSTGVRVMAVCPGPVETEFFSQAERGGGGHANLPKFFVETSPEVVRAALWGLARNRARVIPGPQVWALMKFVGIIPMVILRLIIAKRR
jgi:hypothetical protein